MRSGYRVLSQIICIIIAMLYSCGNFTCTGSSGATFGNSDCEIYVCCNDMPNMLQRHILEFLSGIETAECVKWYGRLKTIGNLKLSSQKWSLTRGSIYSNLT